AAGVPTANCTYCSLTAGRKEQSRHRCLSDTNCSQLRSKSPSDGCTVRCISLAGVFRLERSRALLQRDLLLQRATKSRTIALEGARPLALLAPSTRCDPQPGVSPMARRPAETQGRASGHVWYLSNGGESIRCVSGKATTCAVLGRPGRRRRLRPTSC